MPMQCHHPGQKEYVRVFFYIFDAHLLAGKQTKNKQQQQLICSAGPI